MSRPKPNILLEITNKSTFKSEQVLASDGIWAVFLDNKPINLKTTSMLAQYNGPKYKKTSFGNKGHAINLCKKLNAQFKTSRFTVVFLGAGITIFSMKNEK